jgi:hypothetical protein
LQLVAGLPWYVFDGLVLFAIGAAMGGLAAWFPNYIRWHVGNFRIAEIYDERGDSLYMVARKRVRLGAQEFTIGGELQYIVPNPAPIVLYQNSRGVLHYIISKARPRYLNVGEKGPKKTVSPETVVVSAPPGVGRRNKTGKVENPDTESRSVSLFHRRGFLKQGLIAARGTSLAANIPMLIMVAVAALAISYIIFLSVHPGFYPAPPPGYFYKACPLPTNATHVIIGVTGCG